MDDTLNLDVRTKKRAINWLTSAHFVNDIYSGFLNPLMPFIAVKLGFTMVVATAIMCIAQVCASLIQPIFGFFADNIHKRFFIFWGLFIGSLFVPLAANAQNVYILTIFVILGNLGGSIFHPQALGFVSKFTDDKFMYNMSVFITAGTIGFAFGPIISAYSAQYLGFEKIPYLSIVGVTLALLMFKFVPKISIIAPVKVHKNFKASFKEILSNKYMLILIIIALLKCLITSSCTILLPFLWKNMGHTPAYIGTALFLFLLAGGFGSMISNWFEQRFGAKLVFYLSMTLTFPLMILFVLTYKTLPEISLIVFVLMGFITMFAQPVTMVMAQRILPEYKSIVSGLINGFTWGIVSIILIFVSYMAEEFGIAKVLLITSILPVIFSFLVKYLPDEVES